MNEKIFCLVCFLVCFVLAIFGCADFQKKINTQKTYHEQATEALAVAKGAYEIMKAAYVNFGQKKVSKEQHAEIVELNDKLVAAYLIADDAVKSQDPSTIKKHIEVLCAMSFKLLDCLQNVVAADKLLAAKISLGVVQTLAKI